MSAKQSATESNSKQDASSKKPPLSLDKNTAGAAKANPTAKSSSSKSSSSKPAPSSTPTPSSTPATNKTSSKSGWLLLLVLFVFLGTAGLGWLGYQQLLGLQAQLADRPTHQQLRAPLNNLTAVTELIERQQFLQQALASQQRALDNQQRTLDDQALHLTDVQQALLKSSDPKPRDWQLAEVEYLLRLANQRLQLENDVKGALTLFKTAEQRLRQANVPGTLGVRGYLLEDIEELKALPKLDRISMALSLQTLADKALTLKTQSLGEAPALDLEAALQFNKEVSWYQHIWQEMRSLVVVRQRELPVEALPFLDDELNLRHQLSALLLQASWAALRSEQPLYDASLAAAAKRLAGFDASQPSVADFSQQLSELAKQPVHQKLPETETSLDSLQSFIAQRYSLQLPLEEAVEVIEKDALNKEEQP